MSKIAVIKTGGKQYLVKENETLVVDYIDKEKDSEIELETLVTFDAEGNISLGTRILDKKTKAKVLDAVRGDKVRVSRFKAKVRYRKVKGFRPHYSQIQIVSI